MPYMRYCADPSSPSDLLAFHNQTACPYFSIQLSLCSLVEVLSTEADYKFAYHGLNLTMNASSTILITVHDCTAQTFKPAVVYNNYRNAFMI